MLDPKQQPHAHEEVIVVTTVVGGVAGKVYLLADRWHA
jgi:hypothetical protein